MQLPGRLRDAFRTAALPPGPRGIAALGAGLALRRDPLAWLARAHRRYGGVSALLRAPEPPLGKTTLGGLVSLAFSRGLAGAGILTLSGRDHQQHREVVLRSFARPHLVHYQAITRELAADELARW